MPACDEWPITWPCDIEGVEADTLADARNAARELLWALSGGRAGVCEYVEGYLPRLRPYCHPPHAGPLANNCCRILLRHRPVVEVIQVWENGELLPADAFATDGIYLQRRGGCWPSGDGCAEPPVIADYRAGLQLPDLTARAVGEVACEFLNGWRGVACKLPSRAVSVSRQGVTVELAPADQFLVNGRLGLPTADAWLTILNPDGGTPKRRSRVYSPDLARRA